MCVWIPNNYLFPCNNISLSSCAICYSSSVPIISLASNAVAVNEGEVAEIEMIRSGDLGVSVMVMLDALVVAGTPNQTQC